MSTIYEQLLYTTIRIEGLNNDGSTNSIGTGFLLQRPITPSSYKLYIVSNKHVLMGQKKIALTFSQMDSNGDLIPGKSVRLPIDDIDHIVIGHSNPNVDIATFDCTGLFTNFPFQMYVKWVPYNMISDFTERELTVAENVYFVGYPDNRYDAVNNLPLIRTGMITSHRYFDINNRK